jgi:type IV pilus assembly protein PilF
MQFLSIFEIRWVRRCFQAVSIALLALWLGACSAPGPSSRDTQQPPESDSPESELRRRAALRVELASGYLEQSKLDVALGEVNQALAIDPRYSGALVVRGLVYFRMGDMPAAEQSFQRALAMNSADTDALHNMGLLRCQQRNYRDSQLYFQRALAIPQHRDAVKTWLSMGVCQLRAGSTNEAQASLMHAFELDPGHPIALYNLGKLQYDRKDYIRAKFYIGRLNAQDAANSESLYLGVLIERKLGNQDMARQAYEQLRTRFPNSPQLGKLDRGEINE